MRKIMISQEALECFTAYLDDVQFCIKMELHGKCDKQKIRDLLDELKEAWADTYDPIDLQMARSMRNMYSRYLAAKKAGNMEEAELYLDCYLAMRKKPEKQEGPSVPGWKIPFLK
jgi:hypothetical protein